MRFQTEVLVNIAPVRISCAPCLLTRNTESGFHVYDIVSSVLSNALQHLPSVGACVLFAKATLWIDSRIY